MRLPAPLGAVAVLATLLLGAAPAGVASTPPTRTSGTGLEKLAELDHSAEVFAHPRRDARPIASVDGVRPITGETTVLPVLATATNRGSSTAWLKVRLPGRPDGHTGWIRADAVTMAVTAWEVDIDLSARRVTVLRYGRRVRRFTAVVGKPATPTPTGRFFVEESVKLRPSAPGAPYALALSARSHVLARFDGGPGQIAIHGLGNLAGVPGTAVSHGCVRLRTADLSWLVEHIGPGVPVTITRHAADGGGA